MKKIGEYTTRGKILEGVELRIPLFDGRFDTGFRITKFDVWSAELGSSSNDCSGRLSTESLGTMPSSGTQMDAGDNRQIAWASVQGGSNGFGPISSIVDPDNLVVEDLFFSGQHGGSAKEINYQITMEKYEFSDWKGALSMVRNKSQG